MRPPKKNPKQIPKYRIVMKAVIANQNKPTLVSDREIPRLRDDCVRVKVVTIALNPTDWKHLAGQFVPDGCLVGCDFAGVVEAVGKNVTKKWAIGDRIAGVVHGGHAEQPEDGAFAEYILAKGDICLKIPSHLSFEEAVTLPLGLATVMQGMYQKGLKLYLPDNPIREKAFVLIYGGATATAALGIQFAKLSGYAVISTCSKRNFAYVKSLGADEVFDYKEHDVGTQIRQVTENKLQLAWDPVSNKESARICAEALSSNSVGCRYASFLQNKSPRTDIVSVGTNMYTIWGETFRVGQLEYPESREDFDWAAKFMSLAETIIEQGRLQPHRVVVKEGGLRGVIDGLEELKAGLAGGKLVYRIEETPVSPTSSSVAPQDRLFSPIRLGNTQLSHRIVMAPVTRYRADEAGVPINIVKDYYAQRASVPGTLLVTEATLISPRASGMAHAPGIWSADQIAAWKQVTTAVHETKCTIFLQLWALGRRADSKLLEQAPGGPYPVVSASSVPASQDQVPPHALTEPEIQLFISDYATAANNALSAGFDGVEIHGANGYLPDQFLQVRCNQRTDEYGGSVENRARFALEVTRAVIAAVGDSKKVAMRLSPWSDYDGTLETDPIAQISYTIRELKKLDLAYLHLVESRYAGSVAEAQYHVLTQRNDPFIEIWGAEAPIILAGGFTPDSARRAVNEVYTSSNMCVAFGRFYISTPDLPFRVRENIALNPYRRESFYLPMSPTGYTDYSFSPEYIQARDAQSLA